MKLKLLAVAAGLALASCTVQEPPTPAERSAVEVTGLTAVVYQPERSLIRHYCHRDDRYERQLTGTTSAHTRVAAVVCTSIVGFGDETATVRVLGPAQ